MCNKIKSSWGAECWEKSGVTAIPCRVSSDEGLERVKEGLVDQNRLDSATQTCSRGDPHVVVCGLYIRQNSTDFFGPSRSPCYDLLPQDPNVLEPNNSPGSERTSLLPPNRSDRSVCGSSSSTPTLLEGPTDLPVQSGYLASHHFLYCK
jgi:hypothetical protein